jgi:hypothetical protein
MNVLFYSTAIKRSEISYRILSMGASLMISGTLIIDVVLIQLAEEIERK